VAAERVRPIELQSAVHQQINFGAKHECLAALLKIAQSVTQYGEIKRVKCINSAFD
jgi:hypothetical protein